MDDQTDSSWENTQYVHHDTNFIPLSEVPERFHEFMPRGWIRGQLQGVEGWMLDVGFHIPSATGFPPAGNAPASSSQGPPGLFGQAQPMNVPSPAS